MPPTLTETARPGRVTLSRMDGRDPERFARIMPADAFLAAAEAFSPAAEEFARTSVSLPAHAAMTPQDIDRIATAVTDFVRGHPA